MAENLPPFRVAWNESKEALRAFQQQAKPNAVTDRELLSAADRVVRSAVNLIEQEIPKEWLGGVKGHVAEVQSAVDAVGARLYPFFLEAHQSNNPELRAVIGELDAGLRRMTAFTGMMNEFGWRNRLGIAGLTLAGAALAAARYLSAGSEISRQQQAATQPRNDRNQNPISL